MSYRKPLKRLEEYPIWQHAHELARTLYAMHEQFPEQERIMFEWKLRGRATDMAANIAEACGSFIPQDIEYNLAQARRAIFAIKDSYKSLAEMDIMELDPAFMVEIDKLITEVNVGIEKAWEDIDEIKVKEKNHES